MPQMSDQNHSIAIGLLQANTTVKDVAWQMGVTPRAIRTLRTTFKETGELKDKQRSGTPKVTTASFCFIF